GSNRQDYRSQADASGTGRCAGVTGRPAAVRVEHRQLVRALSIVVVVRRQGLPLDRVDTRANRIELSAHDLAVRGVELDLHGNILVVSIPEQDPARSRHQTLGEEQRERGWRLP